MNIEKVSYRGNPNIGVYIFSNDKVALVPPDFDEWLVSVIARVLGTTVVKVTIGETSLIGIFTVGNNNGILLPPLVKEHEYEHIKNSFDGNVAIVKTRYTAIGNLCLINNRAALVNPNIYDDVKNYIKDYLGVEVVEKGIIANIPTVGSIAYVNDRGGLVHPDASDKEVEFLSNLFGVKMDIGTVNFGVGFIKSGLVGNNRGLLVGIKTTGPEIMRITKVFG